MGPYPPHPNVRHNHSPEESAAEFIASISRGITSNTVVMRQIADELKGLKNSIEQLRKEIVLSPEYRHLVNESHTKNGTETDD